MGETIYKNFGAILGFTVIVLLVENFLGEKASQWTIILTLIGMLLLNADKVKNLADGFSL